MAKTRTLEQAIGAEIKRLREAAGKTQDWVAYHAQAFGLEWGQSGLEWGQATVSAIESGRREVSLGELAMLPFILATAGVTPQKDPPDRNAEGHPITEVVTVRDLIPDTDEWVLLAPGVEARLRYARHLFGSVDDRRRALEGVTGEGVRSVQGGLVVVTEADRKAARALRVIPVVVARAAQKLWRRSLAEERDRRVGDPAATAQRRGRVTRQLITELKRTIKPPKKRRT